MQRKELKTSDEQDKQFQILLSKEDYQKLKQWEKKYNSLQMSTTINTNMHNEQQKQIQSLKRQLQIQKKEQFDFYAKIREYYINIEGQINSLTNHKYQLNATNILLKDSENQNDFKCFEKILLVQKDLNKSIEELIQDRKLEHQKFTKESQSLNNQISILKEKNISLENSLRQCKDKEVKLNQKIKELKSENQGLLKNLQEQNKKFTNIKSEMEDQIESFKQQNEELINKNQFLLTQNIELKESIGQLQGHLLVLKQSINQQAKTKVSKISSKIGKDQNKFELQNYIKQTLRDYARQVKKNLMSIGALSQDEIKQLGTSQLNQLKKYISSMECDFQ